MAAWCQNPHIHILSIHFYENLKIDFYVTHTMFILTISVSANKYT